MMKNTVPVKNISDHEIFLIYLLLAGTQKKYILDPGSVSCQNNRLCCGGGGGGGEEGE